jgi:hypothetical protein
LVSHASPEAVSQPRLVTGLHGSSFIIMPPTPPPLVLEDEETGVVTGLPVVVVGFMPPPPVSSAVSESLHPTQMSASADAAPRSM